MSTEAVVLSERKLAANRRNAQRSTGPKTDAGKSRSARNAVAHGLFCKALVLPGEDADHFRDFQCDLLRTLNPRDAMELGFVQQIVSAMWRIKRVPAAEAQAFALQQEELDQKFRDQCTRQQEALKKQLIEARFIERAPLQKELEALQRQIQNLPPRRRAGELLALMLSRKESPASLSLERLHRHEQRLAGTITRGLKLLHELRQRDSDDQPSDLTRAMLEDAGEANVQNEPTDSDQDANSPSENELATDRAPINTDQICDRGFEPAHTKLEVAPSAGLIGSGTA